jgi:antitoxin ParD1/3/4
MPQIEKMSVALTTDQIHAVQSAVAAGEYATASEAIRDAVRGWQNEREKRAEILRSLRRAWKDGVASGEPRVIDFDALHEEARRRLKVAQRKSA